MRALTLHKTTSEFKPGPSTYHPTNLSDVSRPSPTSDQVLIKILSAGFNHKDLFTRQSLYPGITFSTDTQPAILGADCAGLVVEPASHPLHGKRVVLNPTVGWLSDPDGPEGQFANYGATKVVGGRGTFAEYIAVDGKDVIEAPEHLGWDEAGVIGLGGTTAWRAVVSKGGVKEGQNVLITGIGGGVALIALSLCVALGANVWVTSGSTDKIDKAVALGAKGGVSYKDADWPKQLTSFLPSSRPYLDCVIDSGGGAICNQVSRVLKQGGKVVCYGMTQGGDVSLGMGFVLKNQEFLGSTMGSRNEFEDMVKFVGEKKVRVVVDKVLDGLERAEEGFELMKQGGQFGKIAIAVDKGARSNKL